MSGILLRPYWLSFRNRWKDTSVEKSSRVRDMIILGFALFVMYGIFNLTQRGLTKASEYTAFAYLTPSIPFGLILLFLFGMLFISSLLTSIGTFFTARDLELQLSSPVHRMRLFAGKFLLVVFSSSWMPFIFLFPLLVGYGHFLNAPIVFYFEAALVMIPYFIIPAALAVWISLLGTAFFPIGRTRELLLLSGVLFVVFIALLVDIISKGTDGTEHVDQLLRMLSVLSLPNELWLPSHWTSFALRDGLEGKSALAGPNTSMLLFVATSLLSLSYLTFLALHQRGYARAQNQKHRVRARTAWLRKRVLNIVPERYRPDWAIFAREFGSFSREITQAIQLLLLVGIYTVYLYNVGAMRGLESFPEAERLMWRAFVFIANNAMGAFVVTAACTRFIFPAISLEGASFWIIKTSPLALKRFVFLKFIIWFIPLAVVSFATFAAGAMAVGENGLLVLANGLAGVVLSFGLCGLATGAGAYFVNLKWEHPSQLAASFGSLTFMLCATVLIVLSMVPIGALIFYINDYGFISRMEPELRPAVMVALVLMLISLHWFTTKIALKLGLSKLEKEVAI